MFKESLAACCDVPLSGRGAAQCFPSLTHPNGLCSGSRRLGLLGEPLRMEVKARFSVETVPPNFV